MPKATETSTTMSAAGAATTATEEKIADAYQALTADRFVNGFGIYCDRSSVLGNLGTAKLAVEAAPTTLRSCTWPSDADYLRAEG